MAGTTERRVVHFAGMVQGVGFRYTTLNIARRHDVTGYVRNLHDGRVELVAEGSPQEVGRFLTEVSRRMAAFINKMSQETLAASGEFWEFEIRH